MKCLIVNVFGDNSGDLVFVVGEECDQMFFYFGVVFFYVFFLDWFF